jgi:hypothetical protein
MGQSYDATVIHGMSVSKFMNPSMNPLKSFVQHIATLDPEDIEHWIKVCWSFIDFAERTDPGAVAFLRSHVNATSLAPAEVLLRELGLPEEAVFYAEKIRPKPREEKQTPKQSEFSSCYDSEVSEFKRAEEHVEIFVKKGELKGDRNNNGKKGIINFFGSWSSGPCRVFTWS